MAILTAHRAMDAKGFDEIRKRLGVSFAFVQDSEQRIARTYGVRCWPTTIAVNPDGDVEHIQLGLAHEHPHMSGR